jgi:hypothetical protein
VVSTSFAALGVYPVGLRVTDNASPEKSATTIVNVNVSIPPLAPTADANGPYIFCPQSQPWFLDGAGSVNPDKGQHEPGTYPGDTIQSYEWDLDGDGQYDDAAGAQPDVTAFFTGLGEGSYLIQLKVTDTTSQSFPSSGKGDLSDTAAAQVQVKASDDPACKCSELDARRKLNKVQLTWDTLVGAASYNVYRGTVSGGPYVNIGDTTSGYATYLDEPVDAGSIYYYVVRPAALNGNELCQSNEELVCLGDLEARPKYTKVQLTWSPVLGAASYNVYRSEQSGGPYVKIGDTTSAYSTYLDTTVKTGTTYYYVVGPVVDGKELCMSNQASAKPVIRR